jgi:hypothetical protein
LTGARRRVADVVVRVIGGRCGVDVRVQPPEQRHSGEADEQQTAAVGTVKVRVAAYTLHRLDLSQCRHGAGQTRRELRLRYHPQNVGR